MQILGSFQGNSIDLPVASGAPLSAVGSVGGPERLLRGGPGDGGGRVGHDPVLDLALVELAEVELLLVVGGQLELHPLGLGRPKSEGKLNFDPRMKVLATKRDVSCKQT